MKNKIINCLTFIISAICVFGPNDPSAIFTYTPDIPDEVKNIREKVRNQQ